MNFWTWDDICKTFDCFVCFTYLVNIVLGDLELLECNLYIYYESVLSSFYTLSYHDYLWKNLFFLQKGI